MIKQFVVRGTALGIGTRQRLRAVDDVSFGIPAGRTLALVGESGCGKSTVARMIAGIVPPDAGTMTLQGEDLADLRRRSPRSAGRKVQMVFQDPNGSLNPRMTVLATLAEPLHLHGLIRTHADAREKSAHLLDLVGLGSAFLSRHPHTLSGGQRQRVAIARTLALEPLVLIADEPIAALDVSVAAQIINLLMDLQEKLGLAMLFISHDLRVVRHLADEVAVMHRGRIVEHAPCTDVFQKPTHDYTRTLLDAVPHVLSCPPNDLSNHPVRPNRSI